MSKEIISLRDAYTEFVNVGNYEKAYACLYHWYSTSKKECYPYICEFRTLLNKRLSEDSMSDDLVLINDTLKKAYDLTAQDYFDDFMIALEWNRPLEQKYWLPRRNKLINACNILQEMEEGKIDELFLSMPPRVGKSTLIMFFMIWVMLRNPEKSNLYTSYTESVVGTFYQGILEVFSDVDTYRWQEIFPGRSVVNTNAAEHTLNIDRRKKYSSLTARSISGSLNGSCDCNGILVGDDLIEGIEEALNKDLLNKKWLKVDNNLLPRAKQHARRLWIGTRWSMVDPIARRLEMLENDSRFANVRYRVINFPALNDDEESNFDYACGVGFDTEYYKQRRASFERNNDIASWLAQYQGTPVERNGAVFEPDDFTYFNGDLPMGIEPDRVFIAVDPAWGGGDYVSAPILYQYGDLLYVDDVIFNNGDKRITVPEIVNRAIKHKVSAIYIEATKTTSAFSDEVDQMLRESGYKCNVQSTTKNFTMRGKEQRIFDKAPEIRETFVFLQPGTRSKEYEMFMQNIYSFTFNGKNKHDDAPDSLIIALTSAFFTSAKVTVKARTFF